MAYCMAMSEHYIIHLKPVFPYQMVVTDKGIIRVTATLFGPVFPSPWN